MDNNQMGSSLIDNFEASFMNCIHSFTKQESAIEVDKGELHLSCLRVENYSIFLQDEIKLEVEQTTMKFIDLARQMETFFLQKRFLLSSSKPELLLKEENVDLRHEITRKDELIKKHLQKIVKWKDYLSDQPAASRPAMPQEPHAPPPQPGLLSDPPVPLMPGQRRPPPQHIMQQQQMAQGSNPGMFMPRPGFPQGPMGPAMQGPMGGNPLAFLEKTTNNIDMGPSAPR